MSGKSKSLTTYPVWQVSSENYVGACCVFSDISRETTIDSVNNHRDEYTYLEEEQ